MSIDIVDLAPRKRGIPRDGYGRPMIVPKEGGKAVAHIRTTTFIDALEDKTNIAKWSNRGVLIGATKFPEIAKPALKMDPEDSKDKQKLNVLSEKLLDMAGWNWKREKGTELHELSEMVDAGVPLSEKLPEDDFEDMAAYLMATMGLTVVKSEQMVVVNELPTAGTPDRVSRFCGIGPDDKMLDGHVITDLKTGSIEYGQLKIAAQLATYARGELYDHTIFPQVDTADKKAFAKWKKLKFPAVLAEMAYKPLPADVSRDWGIVINLRPGSGEATLHWVDLRIGWEAALLAKEVRRLRSKSGKAMRPFA